MFQLLLALSNLHYLDLVALGVETSTHACLF